METTGVGETPVSQSIARRRRTVWEGEIRPLRSTSGPHATSMSVGLIVRRSWAHWIHSAQRRPCASPDHQFLQPLPNEKLDEITAKHNGERIGTKVVFVIALKAQYSPTRPIPSSDD